MTREGISKQELFWQGRWHDQCFYSILDHEFEALKAQPHSDIQAKQ